MELSACDSFLTGSEADLKHKVAALEQENQRAWQAQRESEAERRLAERERQERSAECLSWRERHGELANKIRAQEDLRALRQSKAVRQTHTHTHLVRRF